MSITNGIAYRSVLEGRRPSLRLNDLPITLIASAATLPPIAFIVALIWRYGVNVPFWDEWSLIDLFEHAHAHKLSLADFAAQNNEHRLVFPKLIFLVIEQTASWNPRVEMFVSVLLCAAGAFTLQWILRRTLRLSRLGTLVIAFVMSLLLFSPCQHENWLWGYQLACFLLNLCVVAGVAVLCLRVHPTAKFFMAAAFAVVATFSGGNGLTLWPSLLLAFLLASNTKDKRGAIWWTTSWTVAGLCAMALYYFHYRQPSWHPPLAASRNPLDYLCYMTAFVGCPLAQRADTASLTASICIGSIEVGLFLFFIALLIRRRMGGALSQGAPWVAIGTYSLLTAFMACIARIGFGRTQALASRYTTFSLLLLVTLIPLGLLAETTLQEGKAALLRILNRALFVVAILLLVTTFPFGLGMMRTSGEMRTKGHVALTFLNCFPERKLLQATINPNILVLTDHARRANALHLLHPPLIEPSELHRVINTRNAAVGACGALETIDRMTQNTYVAGGWAALPYSSRPADAVILSYRNEEKDTNAFAIGLEQFKRSDADQVYSDHRMNPGWKVSFTRELITSRAPVEIEAWAFDNDTGKLCKLAGSCRLE